MNKIKSALLIVALLFVSQACLSVNAGTIIYNHRNPVSCDGGPWAVHTPFCGLFNQCVIFQKSCDTIVIKYNYNGQTETLKHQNSKCHPDRVGLYGYKVIPHPGKKDTYRLILAECYRPAPTLF